MNIREAMQLRRRYVRTVVQAVSRNIAYGTSYDGNNHTGAFWTQEFYALNRWGRAHRQAHFIATDSPDQRDMWRTRQAMKWGGVVKTVTDNINRAELSGKL